MPSTNFNKMRSMFFFGLIIILLIALLYVIGPFFYSIFWAAVLAVIFCPLFNFINKYLKTPSLSSFITVLLVIVIIFIPLFFFSKLIINESIELYHTVSEGSITKQVTGVTDWLLKTPLAPYLEKVRDNWTQYAESATKTISVFLLNNLREFTQNSVRLIFMMFLMFYTFFYFLKDGPRMLKKIMHLSPLGDKHEEILYQKFTSATRATLKGSFVVGGVQGLLTGFLFWLTGVQGAAIFGLITMFTAMIPALGSFIVWLPIGIVMLALGHVWQGLTILIVGLFLIGTIDNVIKPWLVGKDIQMHPVLVLFSTLGGIFLFGISGFVIGPIIAALFLAVMSIYEHHYKSELNDN